MSQPQPTLTALDHFVLTVANIQNTIAFYERVLGMRSEPFQPAVGPVRHALMFGASKINLHEAGKEFEPKAAQPTPGSADLCFVTEAALGDWITHLAHQKTPIEEGPIARTGATGPLMSIYIRDPDNNLIEISVQTLATHTHASRP